MSEIVEAEAPADYVVGRLLFEEYARELNISLCFQDFAFELEHLGEIYGSPAGCLLLARRATAPTTGAIAGTTPAGGAADPSGIASGIASWTGCAGVRPISREVCEMKRLYVRRDARGAGLGRRLATAAIAAARARGYRTIVLDTLQSMTVARSLYASLGFRETGPYYANPLPDVVYMSLGL